MAQAGGGTSSNAKRKGTRHRADKVQREGADQTKRLDRDRDRVTVVIDDTCVFFLCFFVVWIEKQYIADVIFDKRLSNVLFQIRVPKYTWTLFR